MPRKIRQPQLAIRPVEKDELLFAFAVADAAATLRMPVGNPTEMEINILDEKKGTVNRITFFDDVPINRATIAVSDHFKGEKFVSVMLRLLGLHETLRHEKLTAWVTTAPDGKKELAESLFFAAATAPMPRRTLKFNIDALVKLAIQYDKEHGLIDELPN
jgi:hypothetical protein